MRIEQMIDLIMYSVESKHKLNEIYEAMGKDVPEVVFEIMQAEQEACLILKEVQKLYEATKKEDFGED